MKGIPKESPAEESNHISNSRFLRIVCLFAKIEIVRGSNSVVAIWVVYKGEHLAIPFIVQSWSGGDVEDVACGGGVRSWSSRECEAEATKVARTWMSVTQLTQLWHCWSSRETTSASVR
uniref:Uncharacterized protein n=1 Tax=Ascaris lumbricoides TaxID=6252 RepID=A0A0M3HJT9_ASCLU